MKLSDLELMRYHDLESDADECRRVEERLASDPQAREYLASLDATSKATRLWADGVGGVDVTDDVMARIERDARARQSQGQRRRHLTWSLVASGLAAAACLALWVGRGVVDPVEPVTDPLAKLPAVAPAPDEPQPLAEVDEGVAIEKLDFGANNGSIFVVQGSSEATPVVWLSDPEGDQAKMEPL